MMGENFDGLLENHNDLILNSGMHLINFINYLNIMHY
jgi:hypothetical protein